MNRTLVETELAIPGLAHRAVDRSVAIVQPNLRPQYIPAAQRIDQFSQNLDVAIVRLEEAARKFQESKTKKPDNAAAKLRAEIATLENRLATLRAELAAVEQRGTPGDEYQTAAVVGERSVADLANRLLSALTDREVESRYGVPSSQLSRETVKEYEQQFSALRPYLISRALGRQIGNAEMAEKRRSERRSVRHVASTSARKRSSPALSDRCPRCKLFGRS